MKGPIMAHSLEEKWEILDELRILHRELLEAVDLPLEERELEERRIEKMKKEAKDRLEDGPFK